MADVKTVVGQIGSKFKYDYDKKLLMDHWSVMGPDMAGFYHGDCDDFALTAIWKICDEDLLKFIFNVLIIHRYRMIFTKTSQGENHLVGYAKGLYFDNWSKEALPKSEFIARTKHKLIFPVLSPMSIWYIIVGLFTR